MAKQRLNNDQNAEVYAFGDIGTETAVGYKTMGSTTWSESGITRTNSTTYTVVTKGIYFIAFQQLINPGASNGYFSVRQNATSLTYGYITAGSMRDYGNTVTKEFNVGDTIRIHQDVAITTSWAGGHSSFSIILLRRTA
jgi:hypothetical protein